MTTDERSLAIDISAREWTPAKEVWPEYPNDGVDVKLLYTDPRTGGYAAMVRLVPGFRTEILGYHECTQEQLLLEGSLIETGDPRTAPAYWCHPPKEVHGQTVTAGGAISFIVFDGSSDVTVVDA